MASKCIKECVNDAVLQGRPMPSFTGGRRPEAEAEFVPSISLRSAASASHPRFADCRQMYLRSYTFSRRDEDDDKEDHAAQKKGRNGKIRDKKKKREETEAKRAVSRSKCFVLGKKGKAVSSSAFLSKMVGRWWMSCAIAKVDVSADQ